MRSFGPVALQCLIETLRGLLAIMPSVRKRATSPTAGPPIYRIQNALLSQNGCDLVSLNAPDLFMMPKHGEDWDGHAGATPEGSPRVR
jgi:hypothetical protein